MSNNIEYMIITGPSGVGKTTLVNALLSRYKKQLMRIITHTTRKPRYNEKEGVDYYFLNMKSFEEKKVRGEFIESEKVYLNWYGVSESEIKQCREDERLPILTLSCRGAEKFYGKKGYFVIFIAPESHEILEKRLCKRRTENALQLKTKLEQCHKELEMQNNFDDTIVNKKLEQAVEQFKKILAQEDLSLELEEYDKKDG